MSHGTIEVEVGEIEVTELPEGTVASCVVRIFRTQCPNQAEYRVVYRCGCSRLRNGCVCKRCLRLLQDGVVVCDSCLLHAEFKGVV